MSSSRTGPLFSELKKHASFFLKEKIKSARLALTDVTPAQLLTEEATNASPWAPDTKTMGMISRAAFEVDDYWRIVDILHARLVRFDKTKWRICYKALIILEHLLTHGPESVAGEFQTDTDSAIREMESFQYIDEKGFNWGLTLRKKSQRVQKLLERGEALKEERQRARKLSRGIQGFGSFCDRSSSSAETKPFERSHSVFIHPLLFSEVDSSSSSSHNVMVPAPVEPVKEELPLLPTGADGKLDALSLLDHPFNDVEQHTTASLLLL